MKPFNMFHFLIMLGLMTIFPGGDMPAQIRIATDVPGFCRSTVQRPVILSVINEISPDSIRRTIQVLQEYGSRYKLLSNRKQIADWIVSRFLSYGMTDVVIDSFFCHVTLPVDTSLWQYNVVAGIPGTSAPGEADLIGAHYDSFSQESLLTNAPGADDNASGVAAVLETARVMKKKGYRPESTIMFCMFAAEESGGQGSEYMARSARETGKDIRYMINLDMIANNPDSIRGVTIYKFDGVESAGRFAGEVYGNYTGLAASFPEDSTNNESDSYFFWLYGFPTTFFLEPHFSPNWHTPDDTLGACNISYCAAVAKGACATLMEDQFIPWPRSFSAGSSKESIVLSWSGTKNSNVKGYDLYRSQPPDGIFDRLNSTLVIDTSYNDLSALKGTEYHYFVKTVSDSLGESIPSETCRGIKFAFTDTLLVLNSVPDNTGTPDSIIGFYENVLDTIPFEWNDVNRQHPLKLESLGTHQSVWWMANGFSYTPALCPSDKELGDYFRCGGNMLITGFLPGLLMDNIEGKNTRLHPGSVLYDYFKADSIIRKPSSFMYQAYPVVPGFDTLKVDPDKYLTPGFPGQLQNIEVYTPQGEGTVLYRFDSRYSSTSPKGILQDRPVGLAYYGNDYRSVLLSFPLFYMDAADARTFIHHIVRDIFKQSSYIQNQDGRKAILLYHNFPNPFSGNTTITIFLPVAADILLEVYSGYGIRVAELFRGRIGSGMKSFCFSAEDLPPGIYNLVLVSGNQVLLMKMIHTM